jgi:hypothetical protein
MDAENAEDFPREHPPSPFSDLPASPPSCEVFLSRTPPLRTTRFATTWEVPGEWVKGLHRESTNPLEAAAERASRTREVEVWAKQRSTLHPFGVLRVLRDSL